MAKYLIESLLQQMGEADSQEVILCEPCKDAWLKFRPVEFDRVSDADSDCACEECGL